MRDDEFQLPVVAARYLTNPAVATARKKAFLLDWSEGRGSRLGLLLRELAFAETLATPYASDPVAHKLIASPRLDSTHWRSTSWRDSNAGYANGRFAMDINAIWAPRALEAVGEILGALRSIGFTNEQIASFSPRAGAARWAQFVGDTVFFQRATQHWSGASRHF